jgi:hypothetical protein
VKTINVENKPHKMGGYLSTTSTTSQSVANGAGGLDEQSTPFFNALTSAFWLLNQVFFFFFFFFFQNVVVAFTVGINSLAEPEGDIGVRAWLHMLQFQFSCGRQLTLREVEHKAAAAARRCWRSTTDLSGNRQSAFSAH